MEDESDPRELAQAVEALAKRAADRRTRPITWAEKQALARGDILSAIGSSPVLRQVLTKTADMDWSKVLTHGLAGAGIGAGVGGLGAYLAKGDDDSGPDWRQGMLLGGLAGGGLGAAAGALRPGTPSGPYTGPFRPGYDQYVNIPGKGRHVILGEYANLPEAKATLSAANPSTGETIGKTVSNLAWSPAALLNPIRHPGAWVSGALASGHKLLHSDALRTGDWLGPNAGPHFGFGMIDPRNARNPEMLRRGVQEILKSDPAGVGTTARRFSDAMTAHGNTFRNFTDLEAGSSRAPHWYKDLAFRQQTPGATVAPQIPLNIRKDVAQVGAEALMADAGLKGRPMVSRNPFRKWLGMPADTLHTAPPGMGKGRALLYGLPLLIDLAASAQRGAGEAQRTEFNQHLANMLANKHMRPAP